MPNSRTIIFILIAALAFIASRLYQRHLFREIDQETEALAKENKLYYEELSWERMEFIDKLKMKYSYQDSFSFIKTLFDISNMDTKSIYDTIEKNDLLNLVTENSALRKMKTHRYNSSLEIYDEAFAIVLKVIDSLSSPGYIREPVLIVEKVRSSGDTCYINMYPLTSYRLRENEFKVYNGDSVLDISALPFVYRGDPRHLSLQLTHSRRYEYN